MAFNGHALVVGVGSYEYAPQLNVPITARASPSQTLPAGG